jgi:hypothetical protein
MAKKTKGDSRTAIRGKGWKKKSTIATDKYEKIAKAILGSLTKNPVTFSELVKRVDARLKDFDGSIPWYTVSCLRELETQGKVTRHQKPVLYSKR